MEWAIDGGFILSAAVLIYAYLLYPLLLEFFSPSRVSAAPLEKAHDWPSVSVIVAAYNEAAGIRARVRNFLEGRYPGWSELIVVSDGSTDTTADQVREMVSERVHLLVQPQRRGKAAALDLAVTQAQGKILAFSDATSVFHPEALTNLVRQFADDHVGLATGRVKAYGAGIVGAYHRYERFLERRESVRGVLATAHGCIYAMRRELWVRHDPVLVDDFLAPILVSLNAKRSVAAYDAICVEEFPSKVQFTRQVRMVALSALTLFRQLPALLRSRRYQTLMVLISHKLLRWLTALWLLILAATTGCLASRRGIYLMAAIIQAGFWATVAFGALVARTGRSSRTTFAYEFVAMNVAALVGLWRVISGRVPTMWDTPKLDRV